MRKHYGKPLIRCEVDGCRQPYSGSTIVKKNPISKVNAIRFLCEEHLEKCYDDVKLCNDCHQVSTEAVDVFFHSDIEEEGRPLCSQHFTEYLKLI
jgi:hypothetical protein